MESIKQDERFIFEIMNPTELRIRNYVWCLASVRGMFVPFTEVKILTLGFDKVETCLIDQIPAQVEEWPKYEYRNIEPISLTEKWLLKFGFKCTCTNFRYENDKYMIEKWISNNEYYFRVKLSDTDSIMIASLNYVHQLQNLCFALTGNELTLSAEHQQPPQSQ